VEKYLEQAKYKHDYDNKEIKIVYIPEEYYKGNNIKNINIHQEKIINEFIIEQMKKEQKEKIDLLPTKVYYADEIRVDSIEKERRPYVFFEKIDKNA